MDSDVFVEAPSPEREAAPRVRRAAPFSIRPTCELLAYATRSLRKDRDFADELSLRDAGWLLGGLTPSVVINVMYQFTTAPRGKLDRGVQRLGDLCGALFLEFLCHATGRNPRDAVELGKALTSDPENYEARFLRLLSLKPERALKLFLAFFANTQRSAQKRLSFSVYGLADGA
ncbi:MAG: hypothetical protein QM817_38760 [Archangium sp.]